VRCNRDLFGDAGHVRAGGACHTSFLFLKEQLKDIIIIKLSKLWIRRRSGGAVGARRTGQ
jgi:hypothetical protein